VAKMVRICVMAKAQTVKRKLLLLIAIVWAYAEFAALNFLHRLALVRVLTNQTCI